MLTNVRQKILTGLATSQFFLYGKMHFTKDGYQRHVKNYYYNDDTKERSSNTAVPPVTVVQSRADICRGLEGADGVDLSGKTVVVTGANNGLGKELATYAAAKGANVYMLCRSKERAEKAREKIIQKTSNANVKVLLADVGEMSQVKSAVEQLQSMESQIDCLVCNAGKLLNEKQVTVDGRWESTFASHLLGGSFFLTKLLLPQLQTSAKNGQEPRVIYVTSGGMYTSKFPSWDVATNTAQDQKYDGVMAYTYAKRGQVILAEELAKKDKDGILYMTAHPGWTDTQAVDDAFGENKKMFEPLRDVWEGAEGMAWLMGASASALENGAFYLDRKVQPKHLAGAFMTEGSFTKNTLGEIEDMMNRLEQACCGM